jgi:hypothetical protein
VRRDEDAAEDASRECGGGGSTGGVRGRSASTAASALPAAPCP